MSAKSDLPEPEEYEKPVCSACGFPLTMCVCSQPSAGLTDPYQVEQAAREEMLTDIRRELRALMVTAFLDWARARERQFFMAAWSAVNGAWDDVRKDLRRGRISLNQAVQIAEKLLECKLINAEQLVWYQQQFLTAIQSVEAPPPPDLAPIGAPPE